MYNKLIFEKSVAGANKRKLFNCDEKTVPEKYARKAKLNLPDVSEVDLVRHYQELARKAHGVANGFYPLGSCTMKYNPIINEEIASIENFRNIHPLQSQSDMQGSMEVMYKLKEALCEVTGMYDMTLQPSAGAHGELTSLMMIKQFHESNGEGYRNKVFIPDSAHGTNPASAAMVGYEVVEIPSTDGGFVDVKKLEELADEKTAALMLTNPNTLGIFERDIVKIAEIIHKAGGKLYYDGANMNAIMGYVRPGDMGFDVMHLNLHKTFSTPHGGGGPGSGPVGCTQELAPFLPNPSIKKNGEMYEFEDSDDSIGKVKSFYGNFLVNLRAYTYILSLGGKGLKEASENAVLNANYMKARLKEYYEMQSDGYCMHEFVMSASKIKDETGISALDIAKSMLDAKIHPPTMYFPLIVKEALMVEPTETESKKTLDYACDVLIDSAKLAYKDPEALHNAPSTTPVKRLDEVGAARNPILKYTEE
ncbi:MAG: aminomethyl-transferring glycine dehydrogenase subunit GcvPB [Clostridia bacterium]|nr:aminomethyl-transferring glycine dehydrogenase subunit GcvPB [Clostridia bacterium]